MFWCHTETSTNLFQSSQCTCTSHLVTEKTTDCGGAWTGTPSGPVVVVHGRSLLTLTDGVFYFFMFVLCIFDFNFLARDVYIHLALTP